MTWLAAALAALVSAAPAVSQRAARDTALHDPAEPAPAPLLVPGRRAPGETPVTAHDRAREHLALARRLDAGGELISAVAAYRNAFLLDSTLTGAAFRAGQILASLGDDATAVQMFATEVARNPRDVAAAHAFGLALSRIGQHDLALRQLRTLTRRLPGADTAWTALGLAQLAAAQPAAAESSFRRALALPPPRAREHRDLGAALAARGRPDEARASYRRAIAGDLRDATPWLNLANLERESGREAEALTAYREAEARDSTLGAAIAGQARLLAAAGRPREAGAAYRRWVEAAPLDLGARLEAVNHFVAAGRADMALEIARDALRRDPRSGDAHVLYAVALDAAGDKRSALAALRRAERRFRSDAGRRRARQLIAALRASAPDSLAAHFAADSAAHADTTR